MQKKEVLSKTGFYDNSILHVVKQYIFDHNLSSHLEISYHTFSSYFWSKDCKCPKQQQKTQAVTLLAHARELLDEQRGRGTALPTSALPGTPGAPKQTMQTEIR